MIFRWIRERPVRSSGSRVRTPFGISNMSVRRAQPELQMALRSQYIRMRQLVSSQGLRYQIQQTSHDRDRHNCNPVHRDDASKSAHSSSGARKSPTMRSVVLRSRTARGLFVIGGRVSHYSRYAKCSGKLAIIPNFFKSELSMKSRIEFAGLYAWRNRQLVAFIAESLLSSLARFCA